MKGVDQFSRRAHRELGRNSWWAEIASTTEVKNRCGIQVCRSYKLAAALLPSSDELFLRGVCAQLYSMIATQIGVTTSCTATVLRRMDSINAQELATTTSKIRAPFSAVARVASPTTPEDPAVRFANSSDDD